MGVPEDTYLMMKKTMWMGGSIGLGLVLGMSQVAIASPTTIGQNFTGLSDQDGPVIPADNSGAVGLQHIVQVTNQGFAVYDKTTGQVQQKTSLDHFWRSTGLPAANATNNFDPRVLFDPTSQRWFTIAADRTDANGQPQNFPLSNRVVLAVSESADPTQGWRGFSLPASGTGTSLFADAPTLGIDADGIHIAANMFDANLNNTTSTLFAIGKAQLLSAAPNQLVYDRRFGVSNADYGSSLQPVVDFSNPADGRADFFATAGNNQLLRSGLTIGQGLNPTQSIALTNFSTAPNALQPDGSRTLETGDPRLSSSIVRVGDAFWVVNTSADATGEHAVIRWSEIDAKTNQVKQSGEIGDGAHDYFYPSIAVNGLGNVVIGFNRSGADEYVSSYAIAASTTGGITQFGRPQLLQAGVDNYYQTFGFGRNRWGDSSATVLDPSDPLSFWTFQQVAGRDNQWTTQISQVRVGPTVKTPEPAVGVGFLLLLAVQRRYRRGRYRRSV
jgi:hypothetical protein